MNIIEINVGNKKYKISCSPNEKEHVEDLAFKLDQRYKHLKNSLGDKASDSMILVIIGLMLEDEVNSKESNTASNINSEDLRAKFIQMRDQIDSTISKLRDLKKSSE